jgi:cytochrome c-type biogenesis protein
MGIEIGFIVSAFVAGLIMFLAPCTLPLLPAYLGFISGVSLDDMKDPQKAKSARRKIIFNGIFFILGFSVIFILFGTLAGFLGQELAPFRIWFGRIGGVLVVLFGLFMLGVFRIPALQMDRRLKLPSFLKIGRPESSFIIGSAFAFGWTPCVGPILASILLLASTSSTAFQGAFLLAVFSLGLAVPFILVAVLYARATSLISKGTKYLNIVSIIGGIFLIILGVLLLTDNFGLTIQYGYKYLEFLNYDRLLDFL